MKRSDGQVPMANGRNLFKVKGQWRYYYRAVDKEGNTIDFLLTAKRDTKVALRFFNKAIGRNGKLGLVNIDKSGANKESVNQFNVGNNRRVKARQCKYLNNIVEQDHRRIKRITSLDTGLQKLSHSAKYSCGN